MSKLNSVQFEYPVESGHLIDIEVSFRKVDYFDFPLAGSRRSDTCSEEGRRYIYCVFQVESNLSLGLLHPVEKFFLE